MSDETGAGRNRLGEETSPYLRQHRENPVHWWGWGPEAFAEAGRSDRPVLLSVGYSSCHWCHVMAHESFEDESIAAEMNRLFVPVKVDREERPEVDEIYMAFVQAATGAGGWPLTVFLAPDRTPFFGGTYFPPEDRWGRPGFPRVLAGVAAAWADRANRARMLRSGEGLLERLRAAAAVPGRLAGPGELLTSEVAGQGVRALLRAHDGERGGFGPAPKFPPSRQLLLLLRRHLGEANSGGDPAALGAARLTLERMAAGGLRDQLGGGFHRYSTDAEWLVPHFEKMLYDNALLVPAYLEAHRISGDPGEAEAARATLDWMRRELRSPDGGFCSALDADSEGEEGRFYVWRQAEVEAELGPGTPLFAAAYDLRPEGNWEGRTVLRRVAGDEALGERFGLRVGEVREQLAGARQRLLAARARRVRPGLDDKVLLSWNALAVSAFARAHRLLGEEAYLREAQAAGAFLLGALRREDGRFLSVRCRGESKLPALLDDHAFLLDALLDLFESDHDESWLAAADEVADLLDARFAAADGGFFTTPDDHEPLPVRTRNGYDGALPSGNAVAADALLRLHRITGASARREAARGTLAAFLPQAREAPAGFATLLTALLRYTAEPRQVVVSGPRGDAETERALSFLRRAPAAEALVLFADPRETGETRLPMLAGLRESRRGEAAPRLLFYPCRGGTCERPLDSAEAAREYLTA